MTKPPNKILDKLALLNKTITQMTFKESNTEIIKDLTEFSIKVFKADFGLALGKFDDSQKYGLVYQSKNTPKEFIVLKKESSKNKIIPINYGENIYGSIILSYKKPRNFNAEELQILDLISHMSAQAITIRWLIDNERKTLALAEKQKVVEVLLAEEKLKTQFIANTTHEFRTPLAIIRGNVELALASKDPKDILRTLKVVNSETVVLSQMIADLVILTSNNKASKTINLTELNLDEIIETLTKRLKLIANKKNITIKIKKAKLREATINGNPKLIERLFLNLIENAIIYGKNKGNISINLATDKKNVIVKIEDDGMGISKEDLPHIFERFYRADKAHSDQGEHSGLGLAIVERIAEMHQGKVEAESTAGKGSTFTVSLPLSRT